MKFESPFDHPKKQAGYIDYGRENALIKEYKVGEVKAKTGANRVEAYRLRNRKGR